MFFLCLQSRWAALNELENTDLAACEGAYQRAVYLLEALLHSPESSPSDLSESMARGEGWTGMSDEDRSVVERFVASLYGRLAGVQAKMRG